jgi:proline dehydrogenase
VHTVVATHEPLLLDLADGLADQSGRGPVGLEYQFFLGVQPELQMRTADAGHRVRVLVPYGQQWLEYLHDLARRPSGVGRLAVALLGRG